MTALFPRSILLALVFLAVPGAPSAAAQTLPDAEDVVYRHARTGYATVYVYVWGAADRPGIWEVEDTIDLVELLSAARVRGPVGERPRVEQETTVRLYRSEGNARTLLFDHTLDAVLAGQAAPPFADGDVVTIETSLTEIEEKAGWREIGAIVSTVSSVTLLILRLVTL